MMFRSLSIAVSATPIARLRPGRYLLPLMLTLILGFSSCGVRRKPAPTPPPTVIAAPADTAAQAPQTTPAASYSMMRGVWLTTIYNLDFPSVRAQDAASARRQEKELVALIERLRREGYNTVFFQVRQRGDLIYPGGPEPIASSMTGGKSTYPSGYDPLQVAIDACHARGMELHAWMVAVPIGNTAHNNAIGARSLIKTHRDWCVKQGNGWFLNPGLPAVRTYLSQVAADLAQRYNVDGIHLDYIRYPDSPEGFNDTAAFRKYGKGLSLEQWRRNNITALIKEINSAVKQVKPRLPLSAACLGKYRPLPEYPRIGWTCYNSVFQDPKAWFQSKALDFIVPMMYYKGDNFDPFLEDWRKSVLPLGPVIPGLAVYRVYDESGWPASVIKDQLEQIRAGAFPGVCFYREEFVRPKYKAVHKVIAEHFAQDGNRTQAEPLPPAFTDPAPQITAATLVIRNKKETLVQCAWSNTQTPAQAVTYTLLVRPYTAGGNAPYTPVVTGIKELSYTVATDALPEASMWEIAVQAVGPNAQAGAPSFGYLVANPNLR